MKVKINDIDIEDLFDCNSDSQCENCIINVVCNYIFGKKDNFYFCRLGEIEDFQQFYDFLQLWYESTKINPNDLKPLKEFDLSYSNIIFDSGINEFVYVVSYETNDDYKYIELCHIGDDEDTYIVGFDEVLKGRFYKYRIERSE